MFHRGWHRFLVGGAARIHLEREPLPLGRVPLAAHAAQHAMGQLVFVVRERVRVGHRPPRGGWIAPRQVQTLGVLVEKPRADEGWIEAQPAGGAQAEASVDVVAPKQTMYRGNDGGLFRSDNAAVALASAVGVCNPNDNLSWNSFDHYPMTW